MGTWDRIWNNDVALDLEKEYRVAFLKYPAEEAVVCLDKFVAHQFGASSEEWLAYCISLALFVQRYGIVAPTVINRALVAVEKICTIYEKEHLEPDKAKINQLKSKLLKPVSAPKKIRLNVNTQPVFNLGDVISLEVLTSSVSSKPRYILLHKVGNLVSWQSELSPDIKDIWPVFALHNFASDHLPTMNDFRVSKIRKVFFSDGKMSVYRKRNVEIIGSFPVKNEISRCGDYIFFSASPDSEILQVLNK